MNAVSRHSWQGHFGPDVVSRAWPEFSEITGVVPVSGHDDGYQLAAWPGTSPLLGSGVVAGRFARAKALGKVLGGRPVGPPLDYRPYVKLVVFVPADALDAVRNAIAAAGAGHIGAYSDCTFAAPGTGTFMPGPGTHPYIGREGELERVEEYRLETILPRWLEHDVVDAMLKAHPYEEVAYDLYPLLNRLSVPQAFLGEDGVVRTAEVTPEIGGWAISTGITRIEAETCHEESRRELARWGIGVALVPLGTWTVPGLAAILEEVRA
jgi:hypothetical protein